MPSAPLTRSVSRTGPNRDGRAGAEDAGHRPIAAPHRRRHVEQPGRQGLGCPAVVASGAVSWTIRMSRQPPVDLNQPWPWPPEFRSAVENLARVFGPRPKRLLPPDPKAASFAQVVSTKADLDRLLADKPPLWAWAAFASSLLQQRNSVVPRLRNCASGYQPRPGTPLSGHTYAGLARQTMLGIGEQLGHLTTFMLSPAFTALTADASGGNPVDPNAIPHMSSRLMEYHGNFISLAERCLQTPAEPEASVLVQDTWAAALCPLIGYDQFIVTLCHRVAEARELLAYSQGDISVDNADLIITLPRGLKEQVNAQINRFAWWPS